MSPVDRHEEDQVLPPLLARFGADLYAAGVRHQSRHRRRVALSGLGVVATGATVAILAVSGGLGGPATVSTASAAEVLERTAASADHRADVLPRPNEFFYVRSVVRGYVLSATTGSGDPAARPVDYQREVWLSVERKGRVRHSPIDQGQQGHPSTVAPIPGNGQADILDPLRSYAIGSLRLSLQQLQAFPTDPSTVYRRLAEGAKGRGNDVNGQVFDDIGTALAEQPVPAALRATLYRTLALVPGVRLLGTVRDAAGRAGVAVARESRGLRRELIFDPDTSELLASVTVVTSTQASGTGLADGTKLQSVVYLERGVTTTATRPSLGQPRN